MSQTGSDSLEIAVAEIIDRHSFDKRLKSGRRLVVKLGIDPTSVQLHLGHAVVLRKLRQFQELGCETLLVIGDFTATIGDPAGVNTTRPVLTESQVKTNMKTYFEQAGTIIDLKKSKIVYNSSWLKKLNLRELLAFAEKLTVNTLIDREDFSVRLKNNQSVGLHEFIYPLAQAIDSVELKADIELGGYDQRLNLLTARELQKKMGQEPEELVMCQLLIGTNGVHKMSSSKNNFIPVTAAADTMFGQIMSIKDDQIVSYGELAAWLGTTDQVTELLTKFNNPRDQKAFVAEATVSLFYGEKVAKQASANFDMTFRQKKVADHLMTKVSFSSPSVRLLDAVKTVGEFSASQAVRLIEQGAVSVDDKKQTDAHFQIDLANSRVLKVGKHTFAKLERRG